MFGLVGWSLTSLCHSNAHIETMPAREIDPFTALTSNHQRVDTTTPQTTQPSGLASDATIDGHDYTSDRSAIRAGV